MPWRSAITTFVDANINAVTTGASISLDVSQWSSVQGPRIDGRRARPEMVVWLHDDEARHLTLASSDCNRLEAFEFKDAVTNEQRILIEKAMGDVAAE